MEDLSRRDVIRNAGHGLIAGALAAAVVAGGAPVALGATGDAAPLAPPDKQPPDLHLPEARPRKIGYAVVGLGELAINQILPAIAKTEHCRIAALVSGHPDKAQQIASHYDVEAKNIYSYENYDTLKNNPDVDVIYIVLPNSMHAEYTIRGFAAGKHVLCEKPMAPTPGECQQMIDAGKKAGKKLMIAYRLHYEPYNMMMIELAKQKKFGPIKLIEAANDQNTKAPNIRLSKSTAGGPLSDVGIYCLNATRYITGEEPIEVSAMQHQPSDDPRFKEVPATVNFQLRFPSGVIASCTCGFNSSRSDRYRVVCQDGWMELDPAYSYTNQKMTLMHSENGQSRHEQVVLQPADHFAREMDHMAQCIMNDKEPGTPGEEGLRDVTIMAKIQEAIDTGRSVKIEAV